MHTDGVAAIQEFVNYYCKNNITCALLKLDFAKAFDSVDWSFLLDLLSARGYSPRWISWVLSHLKSGNSSIMVNGVQGNKIQPKRSLRQGDPLSTLLFNLAADVFARIIKRASANGTLGTVGSNTTQDRLSVLQFTNDTMLFTSPLPHHVIALKFILYSFELLFGLSINFDKSSVLVLNNVDGVEGEIANALNCSTMAFPIQYLGFLIRPSKLKHEDWLSFIDKISTRISRWNDRFLSRAERFILVYSVLSTLPIY